jgi:chorismate mutase/prephenate dehydratase
MMTISRRFQYSMLAEHGQKPELGAEFINELPIKGARVVYQGVEGAYGHGATLQYFGNDVDAYHVASFEDVMKEIQAGNADFGVLPIENSSAGAINDNYDLLIKYENYIVAEVFLPVSHALLAGQDTELSDIRTVYSHPQALMQCSNYLNEQGWQQISLANTAVAAKKVIEDGDKTQAAVASEIAGRLYGLKALKTSIQNNQGNTTRFMVVSKKPVYRKNAEKISLCFELPHRYGTLYNVLGNLVFNHVNMLMILSRPIAGRNWEYRFFVDIEGNLQDTAVQNAIKSIEAEASNLRIFGNY